MNIAFSIASNKEAEQLIQFQRVEHLCTRTELERGIFKLIDQNREIFEFILRLNPRVLDRHPVGAPYLGYVEGWLGANDIFLNNMVRALELEKDQERYMARIRKWPGSYENMESYYMSFAPAASLIAAADNGEHSIGKILTP